ncbi:SPT3 Dosage dependent suppressor of Ty-induced promoter mutations-like protein [Serendipita sp. 411]|nr:SPT3 Dosage dependent suppressor of Ty-induced promoter mutations-like protein [Serendipita sp. 411]
MFSNSNGSSPQTGPTTPSSSSNNSDEFQSNDAWSSNVFSNPSSYAFGSPSATGMGIGLDTAAGNEFDMNSGLESCAMPLQDLIHESAMSNSPPSTAMNIPSAVPSAWLSRMAAINPLQSNSNPSLTTNMATLSSNGYFGNGVLPSPPQSATMDTGALFMHQRSFGGHLGPQNSISSMAQTQGALPPDAFTLPQPLQSQQVGGHPLHVNTASSINHTNGMFSNPGGVTRWQLQVHDVPKKSRVETQVKLRLDLLDVSGSPASSSSELEGGGNAVTKWSFIRVPQTASVKTRSKGVCNPDPASVLTLHASMYCASNPVYIHTPVPCCLACRNRENKRNAKKTTTSAKHSKSSTNSKNVTPATSTNATPATSDAEMYAGPSGIQRPYPSQVEAPKDDYDSPIDFTCHEMVDFSSGSTPLSFRIVCYCRHYKERTGFCVLLTLRDNFGRVVGEVKTPPIMIMDDHKSVQKMTPAHTADEEEADNYGFSAKRRTKRILSKHSESDGRIKEEDADEFEEKGVGAIRTKARISRHSTISRSGTGLSKLTTAAAGPAITTTTNVYNHQGGSAHSHHNSQSYTHSESPLPTTAPSSPSAGFSPPPTQSNGESGHKTDLEGPSYTNSLFSPVSPVSAMLGGVPMASMSNVGMAMHGPSLAGPPPMATLPVPQPNPHPVIAHVIPGSGPMTGGIEVTLLGSNFSPEALANACILFGTNAVVFGGNGGARMYSESAILCNLPPSAIAGPVEVKLLGVPGPESSGSIFDRRPPIFTYTDEGDRDLMMQALQVLGWQNSGHWQDARSVAANILGGSGTQSMGGMMGIENTNTADMSSLFGPSFQSAQRSLAQSKQLRQAGSQGPADVEDLVLKVLRSAQHPVTGTIKHISTPHPVTGQTLLHLASALGFVKLVSALIGWSADVDALDKNGFSPVHFACFYGHTECLDTLVRQGRAHLEGRDSQDRTAFDVCGTEEVKDLVLELEEEVETRRRRSTAGSEIESGGEGDDEEDEDEYEASVSEIEPPQMLSRHISRVNSVASIASNRKISRAATPFSVEDVASPLHSLPTITPIHPLPPSAPTTVTTRPYSNSWSLPPMPWPMQFPTGWQLPNVPAMPQFGRRRGHPHGEGQRKRLDEKVESEKAQQMMFMWMEYVKSMWLQQQQQGSTQIENDPPPSYSAQPSTSVPLEKMAPGTTGTPAMPTELDEPPSPLSLDSPSVVMLPISKTSSHSNLNGHSRHGHQSVRRRVDPVEYVVSDEDVVTHSQSTLVKTSPKRKTKTQDTMLIFFWIPVLLFALAFMAYKSLGVAFHLLKPMFEASPRLIVEANQA